MDLFKGSPKRFKAHQDSVAAEKRLKEKDMQKRFNKLMKDNQFGVS